MASGFTARCTGDGEAWRRYSADGDTTQLRRLFVD